MIVKVVDASVVAAICFVEDGGDGVADSLRGFKLAAPTLISYELANIAWKKAQRAPSQRLEIAVALRKRARLNIVEHDVDHNQVLDLALHTKLSAYGASYLWLARKLNAPLVTLDRKLAAAAAST